MSNQNEWNDAKVYRPEDNATVDTEGVTVPLKCKYVDGQYRHYNGDNFMNVTPFIQRWRYSETELN